MYQALYRKYRPQTFDDVVGQQSITRTLRSQLMTGRLSHAYLFTGSRGTGKTTCAKILAKAVNCLHPVNGSPCNQCEACRSIDSGTCVDVLEIDAASNNGVDNVRDLRDDAVYTPAQVKTRVYIIDEVHMLSISAFNALLKIIEEPPEHLLFILATTELHKVPATILSRCQRFSFRRLSPEDIAGRLEEVAAREGIRMEDEAVRILSRLADGALRDGLSLLDQCASAAVDGTVTADSVYQCLGIAGERQTAELMTAVADRDGRTALELFGRLYAQGKDMAAMLDELSAMARDLLVLKTAPGSGLSMLSGVCTDQEALALKDRFSVGELVRILRVLQRTSAGFTRSSSRRIDGELCILTLCDPGADLEPESLNARLSRLEDLARSGKWQAPAAHRETASAQEEGLPAEETPAAPTQASAQPEADETPAGFWADFVARLQPELQPPVSGFFSAAPNAPVTGRVSGGRLELLCANAFVQEMIGGPALLQKIGDLASAMLGRQIRATAVDRQARPANSGNLEQLMAFGRAHEDIVKIKT